MFVLVDLTATPAAVTLESPEDCARFHVQVLGGSDPAHLGAALSASGIGRPGDADHVWVAVDAVKELASQRVGPGWGEEFAAMLSYASSKGWLDADGTAIQAHVEWPT